MRKEIHHNNSWHRICVYAFMQSGGCTQYGELSIEGKASCHMGGDALCSTIVCRDLYMCTNS